MPSERRIALIWAQTTAGVIGRGGAIPWRLPEDMAHFKALTMGHPVIMGRKTWDSLPEPFRPLTGRHNIVVTRQSDWTAAGADVVHSLAAAFAAVAGDCWVIGGSELYTAALPFATELHVTEIDTALGGDAYAPAIGPEWHHDDAPWQISRHDALRFRFLTYLPVR